MTTYLMTIGTDPRYGHNVMHDASRPWAVATMTPREDAPHLLRVVEIHSRHATHKGARQAKLYRHRKAA